MLELEAAGSATDVVSTIATMHSSGSSTSSSRAAYEDSTAAYSRSQGQHLTLCVKLGRSQ